jgi:hypothetical protein
VRPPLGRLIGRILQVVGLGAALWYLLDTALDHWVGFGEAGVRLSVLPLLVASILTVATYGFLVWVWSRSLRWWNQDLPYRAALRIWFVTNLARFIPGAVWQFASLTTEALAHSISAVAATAAMLFQQLVLLGTGIALTLALAPGLLGERAIGWPPSAMLLAVSLAIGGAIILLPVVTPVLERWTSRLLRREIAWPAPGRAELALYILGLVLPWLVYGVAFWLFGLGTLGSEAPPLGLAVGAFTASYVAGIIFVVAPGGLGIREAALVAALAPYTGSAAALFLAIGSRLWLVALEIITAVVVLAVYRQRPAITPTPNDSTPH